MNTIPFSPPDIGEAEIDAVTQVLRSGWITSGPQTRQFEEELSEYCGTRRTVGLSSATAALEMTLRVLGIGPGDEVITTAYTYTASASVIDHTGATIVLTDVEPNGFDMSLAAAEAAVTPRTKAIIAVDLAGVIYPHEKLRDLAASLASAFTPNNPLQEALGRIAIIADAAHSFGAFNETGLSGSVADFTCFSFHAVKNLTTAEGGSITWRSDLPVDHDALYDTIRQYSLHGQTKDALAKSSSASWEYDIVIPGFKSNMTDIQAAIGRVQLSRYADMLSKRHALVELYDSFLGEGMVSQIHAGETWRSSAHLYMVRLPELGAGRRNTIIQSLADEGINTNVHYKPLPLLTAYRNLGFSMKDYPNARQSFENEITLPLYSTLDPTDAKRVIDALNGLVGTGSAS